MIAIGTQVRAINRSVTNGFLRGSPTARSVFWHSYYRATNHTVSDATLRFMNLGAGRSDQRGFVDIQNDCGRNLYVEVLKGCDIVDRDGLELGCGRGGGLDYLLKSGARHVVGVERSEQTLRYADAELGGRPDVSLLGRQRDGRVNVMPASLDFAISVEVLHAVARPSLVLAELRQAVRDEGWVAIADLVIPEMSGLDEAGYRFEFDTAGLRIDDQRDITDLILESRRCAGAADDLDRWLKQTVPPPLRREAREALFLPGTLNFAALESGAARYSVWILRCAS